MASRSIVRIVPSGVTTMFSGFRSPWAHSEAASSAAMRSNEAARRANSAASAAAMRSWSVSPSIHSSSTTSVHSPCAASR